jgi:hypothetical protein
VRKWRQAAKSGDEEASLYLGTMYEKGQGIPQDNVHVYMWYAVAAAMLSGEDAKVAKRLQDHVASRMTAVQIETAQEMVRCRRLLRHHRLVLDGDTIGILHNNIYVSAGLIDC